MSIIDYLVYLHCSSHDQNSSALHTSIGSFHVFTMASDGTEAEWKAAFINVYNKNGESYNQEKYCNLSEVLIS